MFETTKSISKVLVKHQVRLVGLVIFLGGATLTGIGFSELGKTAAASYELKPVTTECKSALADSSIKVDISGAVKNPGLYALSGSARVGDALEQAGGLAKDADPNFVSSQLNLAKGVKDGDKIFIPFYVESVSGGDGAGETGKSSTVGASADSSGGLVSINQASLKGLQTLPQIGEKRAQDIIDGRPYQSLNELVSNGVLSEGIFSKIEELITL